jgi:hypothetical protein
VLLVLLVALGAGLVVGSLVEIRTQSSSYRTSINTGYGALASRVVDASDQTGVQLATLMATASQLPDDPIPRTARNVLQQGLDQAVNSAGEQAAQAAGLVPPSPTGSVSRQFTRVMSERSAATSALRTTVDRLLGMEPLPVAGAPVPTSVPVSAPLISIPRATSEMTAAGALFQRADDNYRALLSYVHARHLAIYLPRSVWVPMPVANAPLGPTRLGASAPSLSASPALVPLHQLVITALGLTPPAVPSATSPPTTSGGPGIVGDSCTDPQSAVPGPAPTVLPPAPRVIVTLTVTNCGNVSESGVAVSQTLTLADPPGTKPPPTGRRGRTTTTRVALRSGSSIALALPPLPVAGGHLYDLTVSVAVPPQANPAGATQKFVIQIAG